MPARRGFSLVLTLSLMILLAVIAVGLLTLSGLSLRSTSQGEAAAAARANARLALIMAIGELQREMGPDSRISAPPDAGGEASGGQPHWTAVYDAWEGETDNPETPESRAPKFRSWLASGANHANGGAAGTSEEVLLVGPGSLGGTSSAPGDEVRVPMHAVSTTNRQGRIAWWTADEAMKAKINAGPDATANSSFGVSDPLFHAQSPPNVNQRAFPVLNQFEWEEGERALSVTTSQVNLAAGLGRRGLGNAIHDLTVYSNGVLTDVRAGRLKRDLSNLLARDAEQLEAMPLYLADGRVNRFSITSNGAVSNSSFIPSSPDAAANSPDEWGINLEELHLFQNLHRQLDWSGSEPRLTMKGTREEVVRDRYYLYKRPVIEAVQFILSLKAEQFGGAGKYRMVMMLDGMVALSNPNDVPIVWPSGLTFPIQLQNVPYDLKWNIQKADGSRNTNAASTSDFGLFVGRISGGTSQPATGFTLAPGEAAVFGSTTGSGPQLDLMRGFVPSGGVRIQPRATNGWDLRATGLKVNDKIDFTLTRGDVGYQGNYTYYNAWIGDRRTGANAKGWQIDACSLKAEGDINNERMNKFLVSPIRPPQVRAVSDFINRPQPIMMISFLRNVERDSGAFPPDAFASRPFKLAEPAGAWCGLSPAAVDSALHAYQKMITAEPMNYQFRTLAAGKGGRNVYQGGGRQPNLGGRFNVIRRRTPIAPPLSLGAFENAIASGFSERFRNASAIGRDPYPSDAIALSGDNAAWPEVSKSIGNSFSTPFLDPDQVYRAGSGSSPDTRTATDHSWMANTALWDTWFLSSIVDGTGAGSSPWLQDARSPREQFSDLAEGKKPLRNKRYAFYPYKAPDDAIAELFSGPNFKTSALNDLAKYLLIDGVFNVNSTSVKAWTAFLSSVRDQELLTAGGTKKQFGHPFGTLGYAQDTATSGTSGDWSGLRDLSEEEIQNLADAIVSEVRSRGPFLSLADFINRRPDSNDSAQQALGVLQAAIDQSGLNDRLAAPGRTVTSAAFASLPGNSSIDMEPNPVRAIGSTGHLSQGDLLTAIGSQIAVRSDTFIIRVYGDSRDASGKILAKAWCEAVVQRVPDYLDPGDSPEAEDGWPQSGSKLTSANSRFGRRITVQSFRWLSSEEI